MLARCRAEKVEPPGRMDRIIGAANRLADTRFCRVTVSRLPADVVAALWATLGDEPNGDESGGGQVDAEAGLDDVEVSDDAKRSFFNELKQDPGRLGLETLLAEIVKLRRARAIGLPADLFTDVAEKRVARWRARAAAEYPSTLRRQGAATTTRRR